MKITTENLRSVAKPCARIAKGGSLPILACALLSASGGWLTITVTTLDQTLTLRTSCDGDLSPVCVPAGPLAAFADNSVGDVTVTVAAGRITLKSRATITLPTMPAEEFPPTPKAGKAVECDAQAIARGIDETGWAVSTDASRYVCCGVNVAAKGGNCACSATDGRWLTVSELTGGGSFDFIIPTAALDGVTAALRQPGAVMRVSENAIDVIHDGGQFRTKLVEGQFPNYKQVIPQDPKLLGVVAVEALSSVVQDLLTVVTDKCHGARFEFGPSGITGTLQNENGGKAESVAPGQFKKLMVSLDPVKLAAILRNHEGDLEVFGTDELSPIVFKQAERTTALMPMRLS